MNEVIPKFEPKDGEWYSIPQFPQFKINRESQIKMADSGQFVRVYRSCIRNGGKNAVFFRNWSMGGKSQIYVSELVKRAFYDRKYWDYVTVHKDGDKSNDSFDNIILLSRTMFWRRILDRQNKPWIIRIGEDGRQIQRFPTIKFAARECGVSTVFIRNRCNHRTQKQFAFDGTTFRYEGDEL